MPDYLKNWSVPDRQSVVQTLTNWFINWRIGLSHRHEYYLYRLVQTIPASNQVRILEIGAGSGWSLSFDRPNLEKYVIDQDDYYKGQIEDKGCKFLSANIERINISDLPPDFKHFDLIILNHVIEHVHDPDNVTNKLKSLLVKDGRVYLRTPDISRTGFKFFEDYTHVRPFTKNSISQLFCSHGFSPTLVANTSSSLLYVELLFPNKIARSIANRLGKDIEAIFTKSE